ncbi:arpA protein [Allokutzneria sp. A3M-2-11 16]|uniref:HalD/BesD family halogenase n=1 Tax=Allokutzneria sp. A3M-2-11 16 TaxID=2962043 RepID=UPI0020B7B670|nr:arpA protein [Allokutzneria sp. A3M-2-11 16]MCP3802653.1 arpA protein [Allokutzneria sp. A3M-2-11 16]
MGEHGTVVDVGRYPLAEPGSAAWREVVEHAQRELKQDGCCVLEGFVRDPEALQAECAGIADRAYNRVEVVNAYNIAVDAPLPEGHPGRIAMKKGNAFVARDHIPADFVIEKLYTSEAFREFVAACFELPVVHELADPLSGLCLNVIEPGLAHPWHFDTNEYTVSMLTQEPDEGGVFEYCPNIRTPEAENFADVAGVLNEERPDLVRRLTLRPGDLQLFKGRYALHRVTQVGGARARHSAIFAYSERPGVIGSVERTRQLFGRVLPEHRTAAVRSDQLLD